MRSNVKKNFFSLKNQTSSSAIFSTSGVFTGVERVLPVVTFFSGVAALIYESLWMRSFGLIFGNTTHAITVILATYMGGIALGSHLAGRVKVSNPLKTYAFVELLISISAVVSFLLLRQLPEFWGNFSRNVSLPGGFEVPLRIILSGLIILIPTLCMGATVPLLVQILSRHVSHHKVLSRLYYMNTLGGAAGVLITTYLLFPGMGLSKAYSIAIIINFIIAVSCGLIVIFKKIPVPAGNQITGVSPLKTSTPKNSAILILVASIAGGTSFCLEILWSRSFALVIGSSIYSFNLMLFSFLLGLVIGTWLYEKYWEKIKNPFRLLVWLLLLLGSAILLSSAAIGWLPLFYYSLMDYLPLSFSVYQVVGFLLCFMVMVLITSMFGFIFPLLLRLVKHDNDEPTEARLITSKLYAWNTLGTLIGALLTGFLVIPLIGLEKGYVFAAALPIILGIFILGIYKKWNLHIKASYIIITVTGIILLGAVWKPWEPLVVTSGTYKYGLQQIKNGKRKAFELLKTLKNKREIVYYKEGIEGVVAVTNSDGLFLSVNGKTDASEGDLVTQKMLAHVPLALNPNAKNALIIGWGSGCTSGTASLYPLKSIKTIEIEPAVYESRMLFSKINNKVFNDPRFQIIFKDGRNVLLTTPDLYDVIISEPSNPWITGVSNLFTRDFYKTGLARLNKQGIFCQWFHIYDMPMEVMKSQVRTFCSVFPDAMLWVIPTEYLKINASSYITPGDVLLIGSRDSLKIDMERIKQLFNLPAIKKDLASCMINDPASFISNAQVNRDGLLRFCGNAPLNTDDYPYVEFNAPRGLFHNQTELLDQNYYIYSALTDADTTILPPITNEPLLNSPGKILESSELFTSFGNIYAEKKLYKRAERAYEKAYMINPESFATVSALASLYMIQQLNEPAVTWCKKALQLNRKDIHTWDMLGIIYYKMGDFNNAKDVYSNMMNEFPKDAHGAFSLGIMSYKEGNFREAKIYLGEALKLNPGLESARKVLESMNN